MKAFVIMPFKKVFNDVFYFIKEAVKNSVTGEKIECFRLDEKKAAGKITDDFIDSIETSTFCIADLTGNNPNVMWEVGYAIASKKPTIFICQDLSSIPFDLRDMKIIEYEYGSLSDSLTENLTKAINETLAQFEVKREATKVKKTKITHLSVAVTGSMRTEISKTKRRIQILFQPYLGEKTKWYCGSYGVVDEIAVEFLAKMKQNITVVGYHSYDLSSKMIELLRKYDIPFLDATQEQIPKGIDAPSERDLLFAMKSDIVILIWDGKSDGTKEMIDWYKKQEKDHIIGFV